MHRVFSIGENVKIFDYRGRCNVPAKIIAYPTETDPTWTVEYVGENEYGLTGIDNFVTSDIQRWNWDTK